MTRSISINNLFPNAKFFKRTAISGLDALIGVKQMNRLYQHHQLQNLSKEDFADKLISILGIRINGIENIKANIPKTGPVVIASNHPFGGIEGVILARIIGSVRPDLKVLANRGLGIFHELTDYFIFTNPLSEKDPRNGPSLRQCLKHVNQQGALLIFPAGRVSYYQADKKRISEHTWNKLIGRLISISDCQYVPVFIDGTNSKLFYRLGRVYYRFRMLMLARELLNKRNSIIKLQAGYSIKSKFFSSAKDYVEKAELCRAISYAQSERWLTPWSANKEMTMMPVAPEANLDKISIELSQLPETQRLLEQNSFSVFYGFQRQIPTIVQEIARLREIVFRQHNEGSGQPQDTDKFDATYTHLVVYDNNTKRIIGAYRMGQTDILMEKEGIDGLYLSHMFNFKPTFLNRQMPCLEMGRSFLIPEYQNSFQGLLLLWRGIGAFVCANPQYKTLYGTVSISKLYNPKSVKLIEYALVPSSRNYGSIKDAYKHVSPKEHYQHAMEPEIADFAQGNNLEDFITVFLKSLESDGKDVPVLLKQYKKMGAKWHALGIDTSFNNTPGLLLSVDLPNAPEKLGKLYLQDGWEKYKNSQ